MSVAQTVSVSPSLSTNSVADVTHILVFSVVMCIFVNCLRVCLVVLR